MIYMFVEFHFSSLNGEGIENKKSQEEKMKKLLKFVLGIVVVILAIVGAGVGYLTAVEYRPEDVETLEVIGNASKKLSIKDKLSILTFNVGYGCNDKDSDFFMDGGKKVLGESKEVVEKNMKGIQSIIEEQNTDVVFLQEIDKKSKRAYKVPEIEYVKESFEEKGNLVYSRNYDCKYVPYPWPTTGLVNSGAVTLNSFEVIEASRYNLPTSYKWPIRVCQLKRGLLVERVPLDDSDKEVILVNLHLEAYDTAEGKTAQTKVLVDLLKSEYKKGNYVIAGGDFNQSLPDAGILDKYPIIDDSYYVAEEMDSSILPDTWQWAADTSKPSARLLNMPFDANNKNTQYYVIDGFILSPNVKLETIQTIDEKFAYSDHNPVRMEISFH